MFPTTIRRIATGGRPTLSKFRTTPTPAKATAPLPGIYGRYKPKKVWPPDFTKLSEKEQFKFEKRYKRRVILATARPRWDKNVKLAQLVSITAAVVYMVLFMDWKMENPPFEEVRHRFWSILAAFSPERRYESQRPGLPVTTTNTTTTTDEK
ncbi:hypothetical protein F4808DRAFT_55636 [Astrocystis sublimbata]|nr:hypothetical protein F4808DRAFT_55636 [Astrocystis sublimbata]